MNNFIQYRVFSAERMQTMSIYFEICMVSKREKHPAIEVHAILMLVETAEFIT